MYRYQRLTFLSCFWFIKTSTFTKIASSESHLDCAGRTACEPPQ